MCTRFLPGGGASVGAKLARETAYLTHRFASQIHSGRTEERGIGGLALADDIAGVQATFLLRGFFPPPAAFALVLVR